MTIEEIVTEVEKVKGWFTPEQQRELYPLVSNAKGLLVEIGTYHGKSTKYWRLANPKLEIITIDIINDPDPPTWVPDYTPYTVIDQDVLFLGNITAVLGNSRDFVKHFTGEIEILFIDGDERYNSIYADMDNWWPFVKPGGHMIVHNYFTGNIQTKQAVDDWIKKNGVEKQIMAQLALFKK